MKKRMKRIAIWVAAIWVGYWGVEGLAIEYYSVQDGSWHLVSTWTNEVPSAEGTPSTEDSATVRHTVSTTQSVIISRLNLDSGRLFIQDGAIVLMTETGVWHSATLAGSFQNAGKLSITGEPASSISGTFANEGEVTLVQTPSLLLNGRFQNTTQAHFAVWGGITNWSLSGTGSFWNAGAFHFFGKTGEVSEGRFYTQGGTMHLGSGSSFRVQGRMETNQNGHFWLEEGSVFQPVSGGTSYYSGVFTSEGEGSFMMRTGTLRVGYFTTSNPTFAMQGGGFVFGGGTMEVHPSYSLENRGILSFAEEMDLHLQQPDMRRLLGRIANYESMRARLGNRDEYLYLTPGYLDNFGRMDFVGGKWIWIGSGPSSFNNSGEVRFAASGKTDIQMPYVQHGGRTSFEGEDVSLYGAMYGGEFVLNGGVWDGGQSFYQFGGSIGGAGRVANHLVQSQGTVSPGYSPGKLDIEGSFEQTSAEATLRMEIGGVEPGVSYDQLAATSTGTLAGTLTVELLGGYEPPTATRFDLVMVSERKGEFAQTNLPVLSGDRLWVVKYFPDRVQIRVGTPQDTDGDALRDAWEMGFFGNLEDSDGADDDFDEDGYTDAVEMMCDTLPQDPTDYLAIRGIERSGEAQLIRLHTASNVYYAVDSVDQMVDGEEWTQVGDFWGVGGEQEWTNTVGGAQRMLRVRVTP